MQTFKQRLPKIIWAILTVSLAMPFVLLGMFAGFVLDSFYLGINYYQDSMTTLNKRFK